MAHRPRGRRQQQQQHALRRSPRRRSQTQQATATATQTQTRTDSGGDDDDDEAPRLVLSEVHMLAAAPQRRDADTAQVESTFEMHADSLCPHCLARSIGTARVDADGDLELPRRCVRQCRATHAFVIAHRMQTTLADVGLQVWRGALLMCDYLAAHQDELRGKVVVELGAGVGLVSIVAGMFAQRVYCTDVGDALLANCASNVARNNVVCPVVVRSLDWLADDAFATANDAFKWSDAERADVRTHASIFLAADVIYDDDLTTAFLRTTRDLLLAAEAPSAHALVAMEKRINFSLSDLAARAHNYDHLVAGVSRHGLRLTPVHTATLGQRFAYDRAPELVLVRLDLAASDEQ